MESLRTDIKLAAKPSAPPAGIAYHIKHMWAKEIKAVVIIPNFRISTRDARDILPSHYNKSDVVGHPIASTQRQ